MPVPEHFLSEQTYSMLHHLAYAQKLLTVVHSKISLVNIPDYKVVL